MGNYLATVTIGDFVGPETLESLRDWPRSGELNSCGEFLTVEEAQHIMGADMSQWSCWKELWLYGIIVDDDMEYYIPDDYDTEVALLPRDGGS